VALAGLSELTRSEETSLPFSLSDIPRVSADTVPAVIEWAAESLEAASILSSGETTVVSLEPDELGSTARSGTGASGLRRDRYHSADIVAALGGGSQAHLRRLVKGVIEDTVSQVKPALAVKRARAVALVAAALEASERAGLDTAKAWDSFGSFVETCRDSGDSGAFGRAVLRILNTVKKAAKGRDGALPYAELNALLLDGLEEGVTLAEVAAALGVHPTAVTHRLQRKFGMSFSEYQGRIRVDTAKELLRKGKLSVVDVARRVGLNDGSNFSKLFRKHEGMTPTAYRKRFGKGTQTS
jgi:two-component system response regulator YesN